MMAKTHCPIFYAFTRKGFCVPVYCHKWQCDHCAKVNAKLWAWRATLEVDGAEGAPYYFITLTLDSRYSTPEQGFRELPKIWNRVRMWMVRALLGTPWHYMAVVEGQPNRRGMPHFHILSNFSVARLATGKNQHSRRKRYGRRYKVRVKDWAVARGMGFQADESRVNGSLAAGYVAKYTSKQHPAMPRGFRRVRASRSWAKLPDREGDSLIVKAASEKLWDYLSRVSRVTGVDIEQIHEEWLRVNERTKPAD